MVQIGDVIRVKDFQSALGVSREPLNVYFFEVVSITGLPVLNNLGNQLETWWYSNVITELLDAQSANWRHTRLVFENLMAWETEFIEITPDTPVAGRALFDFVGPITTYSLKLNRTLRTTRNGRKSLGGVPENLISNNVIAPTAIESLTSFGEQIVNPVTIDTGTGVTIDLLGVIAKSPVPPATLPSVFNRIGSVSVRGLGSQTSRRSLG